MSMSTHPPRTGLAQGMPAFLRSVAEAFGSLRRREWAGVLAVGLLCGMSEGLRSMVGHLDDTFATWQLAIQLRIGAMKVIELVLASVLLAVGLRWLDQRHDGGPSFAVQAALIGLVSLLVAMACSEPMRKAIGAFQRSQQGAEGSPGPVDMGPEYSELVLSMGFFLATYLLLWTLVYRFLQRSRRSAEQLAVAQARGVDAERRVLAEQLAGAQAMVEPAFLFDTLQLADRLLDRDTVLGQRLLGELHRYLRAALPPADGSVSTLGQQTELLRARLAIEAIRLHGRLEARIEVHSDLAARPLAPMLLLPLTTNAVRHAIEPAGGGEIVVRVTEERGRLSIEVADSGAGRAAGIRDGAGLAALRERLAALYGQHASLVFADRDPRGVTACIQIRQEAFS